MTVGGGSTVSFLFSSRWLAPGFCECAVPSSSIEKELHNAFVGINRLGIRTFGSKLRFSHFRDFGVDVVGELVGWVCFW